MEGTTRWFINRRDLFPRVFIVEKVDGFRYLFADREVRVVSIISFAMLVTLVSTQYLVNIVPDWTIVFIGYAALALFTYLLSFFVAFNVMLAAGKFRDNWRHAENMKFLRGMRAFAVSFTLVASTLLISPWLAIAFILVAFSFIAWIAISTLFFCKFIADIARSTRFMVLRAIMFVFLVIVYVAYLLISLVIKVGTNPPTNGGIPMVSENLFNMSLDVFLLLYGYATMGQRFMPKDGTKHLDFDHLTWRQEVRLRESVLFVLLVAIGYELMVRALAFVFARADAIAATDFLVTLLRLAFLLPGAILFFFVALFKPRGKRKSK